MEQRPETPLLHTAVTEDSDQKVQFGLFNIGDGDKILNCFAPKLIQIYITFGII